MLHASLIGFNSHLFNTAVVMSPHAADLTVCVEILFFFLHWECCRGTYDSHCARYRYGITVCHAPSCLRSGVGVLINIINIVYSHNAWSDPVCNTFGFVAGFILVSVNRLTSIKHFNMARLVGTSLRNCRFE